MITALDHIQLPMPEGREDEARGFFGRLLALEEIEKPPSLARRGGVWFAVPDGRQLHLGVEEPFRPNRKAHPAFVCAVLDDLASGELYWDRETIRQWADGLTDRMGSFPGIPRPATADDLPP